MTRSVVAVVVCAVTAVLVAALVMPRSRHFTVISYNVQNLFDGRDDGREYAGYRAADGYTNRSYWQRLDTLAAVLTSVGAADASAIVLQEVEHAGVAEDLTGDLMAGDWQIVGGASPEFGTQVVVALRSAVHTRTVHAASVVRTRGDDAARVWRSRTAVAVVTGRPDGDPVLIYGAHWRSRRGGEAATEAYRVLEERLADRVISAYRLPGVLVGDLNRELTARWSELGTNALTDGFFRVGGFATLWSDESGHGSYWFDGRWQRIDHGFLYLPPEHADGRRWEASLTAASNPGLLDGAGTPHRYTPRTGAGVSDHLPLVITLARPRRQ